METCPICGQCTPPDQALALQRYIGENIVLARAMGCTVRCVGADGHVVLAAPLSANTNDKGTGFAGSLSSLAMLACWASAAAAAERLCSDSKAEHTVVARDASVRFCRPVRSDFVAVARPLAAGAFEAAAAEYQQRGRAHIAAHADVFEQKDANVEGAAPCLALDGTYVVLLPADAGATRSAESPAALAALAAQ